MNSNTPAQKNQAENSPISPSNDFLKNKGSLISISVQSIIADFIFQMRENGIDDVIVRRYAEVMLSNDPDGWQIFPRITVLSVANDSDDRYCPEDYQDLTHNYTRVYVVGGFHRLAAMQECGYAEIEAVVINGSTADGIVFAAGENDDKSVRRTLKDIRRAVISCLTHPEIKTWVNPKIAEICGVDVQTVRNWEIWLYKNDPDYSRPENLKFRDKYGGVGLRKHSIPNFAVEDEKAEAKEEQKTQQHNKADVQPNKECELDGTDDFGFSKTDADRIKFAGLRSVLERAYREGVPKNIVKDGKFANTYETIAFERAFDDPQYSTDLANLYETTPEKVLALRDEIIAEKAPHEGYKIALEKAMKAMDQAEQTYAICQSKLGLDELPWRSHIGPCFWNYAQDAFGVTGIEDGQKPVLVEPSDSMRIDRLNELRTLWYRVDLAIKAPGDWVKALKPDIDGLKEAMRQRIKDLRGFVGSGLNLAKLYHTTPEKVIEIRNSLLAESEPEQPSALQVEPLGTADSAPSDERPSINFKNLGGGTKGNIRQIARASKSLLEEEDLTEDFKAILSSLLNTIIDFADSDELLKKILEANE